MVIEMTQEPLRRRGTLGTEPGGGEPRGGGDGLKFLLLGTLRHSAISCHANNGTFPEDR
jgi:hypothetical protein